MRYPEFLSKNGTIGYVAPSFGCSFEPHTGHSSPSIKFSAISTVIITAILIFDYYVTTYSGSQFLFRVWWIGAIFVSEGSLFLTATALKIKSYNKFFNYFWLINITYNHNGKQSVEMVFHFFQ